MATVTKYAPRDCWRVLYAISTVAGRKIRKSKYCKSLAEAEVMSNQLTRVETASRTGVARLQEIEECINRGWLKSDEAEEAFVGYGELLERKRRVDPTTTDYQQILSAFDDYSATISKGGGTGRDHGKNLSQARKVIEWLEKDLPDLATSRPK